MSDALTLLEGAVDDAHRDDHAEIDVVPAVDKRRLERGVAVALGGGRRVTIASSTSGTSHGLGRDHDGVRGVVPDHVLDLLLDRFGLGGRSTLLQHGTISWPASMA